MNASKLKIHDEEIVKRYLSGESARSIARSLGSYDSSVSYRLKILGVSKRSISEASRGRGKSISHRQNVSKTRIELKLASGDKNPNWRGGIADKWSTLKNSNEYKLWRDSVLKRDAYTCMGCGSTRGNFDLHHILPKRDFPQLVFAINNGITLCKPCHKKTHFKEYDFVDSFKKIVNSGKPTEEKDSSTVIPSQAGSYEPGRA